MPLEDKKIIAIIGAGCSGAMVAINLLQLHKNSNKKILLIDKSERMGRGLAYRTWDDNHVLNVPAGNMSALVDDPQHFVHFCQTIDPAFSAGSFVSRRLYGDYIEHTLAQAELHSEATLQRIPYEAVAVHPAVDGGARIEFDGADAVQVDAAVLALGHLAPLSRIPAFSTELPADADQFYINNPYINNPWKPEAFDGLQVRDRVLIVGTGHTAVDMLFSLTNLTDQRKIYMLSRRGLLSHAHRQHAHAPALKEFPAYLENVPATARHYFRAVRKQIALAAQEGTDWRDIIAPLRPHTPAIWQRLSVTERSRFFRHAWAYWDIHRHRLSPSAYVRLHDMIARGQVEIIAGRVQQCQQHAAGVDVSILQRKNQEVTTLAVKRIINCAGMNYDISKTDHRLFKQLLADGLVQQDVLKIGLEIDEESYAVINRDGVASRTLFYTGPMLRAQYLEAIGVPELRMHANRLARIVSA